MTGIELITEERKEQIDKHGMDSKHDLTIGSKYISIAAAACATPTLTYEMKEYANQIVFVAPHLEGWKLPLKKKGNVLLSNETASKEERIKQLRVAGALCAAAIDVINSEGE